MGAVGRGGSVSPASDYLQPIFQPILFLHLSTIQSHTLYLILRARFRTMLSSGNFIYSSHFINIHASQNQLFSKIFYQIVLDYCVADNLCSDHMSSGLSKNGTPNGSASAEFGVRATNGSTVAAVNGSASAEFGVRATNGITAGTVNGSASAEFGVHATNGRAATAINGSGDATSQHSSHQQQPKAYVRVYDYMCNWSPYDGACENNKTLVTQEMETQDTEMMDMEDAKENSNYTQKCNISSSAIEHSESVIQAQGYDSKLCETMFDIGYGHAY